jgi:membrane fusion protein (multidrug efflux system)
MPQWIRELALLLPVVFALQLARITMRPSYNTPEAPTHLRAGDLPPGLLDDVDPPTSASRHGSHHSLSASSTKRRPEPAPLPAAPRYAEPYSASVSALAGRSRSVFDAAPRVHTEPGSAITPPARPARSPRATPASVPVAASVAALSPYPAPIIRNANVNASATPAAQPARDARGSQPMVAAAPVQPARDARGSQPMVTAVPVQHARTPHAQLPMPTVQPVPSSHDEHPAYSHSASKSESHSASKSASKSSSKSASKSSSKSASKSASASQSASQSASKSASKSASQPANPAPGLQVPDAVIAQIAAQIAQLPPAAAAQAAAQLSQLPPAVAAMVTARIAQIQAAQAAGQAPAPGTAQPAGPAPSAGAIPGPGTPGVGSVDPLAIPTPPELAGPIYGHIRRLALQADLAGADRVMRDALADLTSSLSVSIIYPGQDGLWTLGNDDEIPRDAQPLVAVASTRRAVIGSHMALVPVVTSTETVGVIILNRNPRQPAFQLVEQVAMVAMAREAAPIMHHLAVAHLQHANEIKADKGSLYRGEALEAHRNRGQEGMLVQLSPTWVKRAYPILCVTLLLGVLFATFVKVPTYSAGTAVIVFEGSMSVTAGASGTVEKIFVKENEAVKKGDPLLRLNSPDEAAQLTQSETEWHDTQVQFLFDQTDEQARKALMSAATARDHALARVEARTVRAPRDGVVTNLHIKEGAGVQLGSYVMQITDENSEIEALAFLPGKDLPRIREKMALQLELEGYTKARAIATITHVQADAISATEAAKLAGDMLAESVAKDLQTGTWIAVRARMPSRTFKTEHSTFNYHHGMHAKVEVKVQSKPFLVTLLPALGKYLPD